MKKHIYKITIFTTLCIRKHFKISSSKDIDDINNNIREQCNGNLVTFMDLNNKMLHFDRNTIEKIYVQEVK